MAGSSSPQVVNPAEKKLEQQKLVAALSITPAANLLESITSSTMSPAEIKKLLQNILQYSQKAIAYAQRNLSPQHSEERLVNTRLFSDIASASHTLLAWAEKTLQDAYPIQRKKLTELLEAWRLEFSGLAEMNSLKLPLQKLQLPRQDSAKDTVLKRPSFPSSFPARPGNKN